MNKLKCEELERRTRNLRDDLGTEAIAIVRAALNYHLLPVPAQIEKFRMNAEGVICAVVL